MLFAFLSPSIRGRRKATKERAPEKAHPALLAAQPHIPGCAAFFVDIRPQKAVNL
jgi:hypothetical protein